MEKKYPQLLKPLVVQGVVLRNRLYGTKGLPHFMQAQEEFPSENVIRYYAGLAKNGAAVVTVKGMSKLQDRRKMKGDSAHMTMWDIENPATFNAMAQIANMIHYYGSKAFINIQRLQPAGVNISEVTPELMGKLGAPMGMSMGREITREEIQQMISDWVDTCKLYQDLGYDGVNIYASYQASIFANAFSPLVNRRTDEYGGSLENRCRLILELAQAIKAACGKRFLVELQFSGEEGIQGGYTIDDTIELLRRCEGYVDIVHIRAVNGDLAHTTGLNSVEEAPITLRYSEAIKKAGVHVITAPNGGYQDPDLLEKWIAEGKLDMAAMCRSFICDFDYYDKIVEGRADDITPCIRCNNCHGINFEGPWFSFCSVNPELGLYGRKDLLAPPAKTVKKVAVIGGGPAGMRAALVARQRGHQVTLFEKKNVLGGQLIHADYADFKWPLKKYKDWLIYQLHKQGVTVQLNTAPTPEEISAQNFDAVIAATGAVPKKPGIPGDNGPEIWNPIDVFGHEAQLGKNVVVVGGSETGVETALYLCDHGHNVTVLSRQKQLASDANQIHYISALQTYYSEADNFRYAVNATTTAVTPHSVTFTVKTPAPPKPMPGMPGMPGMPMPGGNRKPTAYPEDGTYTLECDSVVVCGGVAGETDAGLQFADCAPQFFLIGDCNEPGRVYQCTRAAYAAASQI